MSMGFTVAGPCVIQVTAPGLTVYADLGYSDNDDLFSAEEEVRNEPMESTDKGRVPEDLVFVGSILTVTGTLAKLNRDILRRVETLPGEDLITAEGARGGGVIGSLWSSHWFGVKILPKTAGKISYEMKRCFIDGNQGLALRELGNTNMKVGVQFFAIPDSDGNLYTTATTA